MRLVFNPSYIHSKENVDYFRKYKDNFFYKDYTQYSPKKINLTLSLIPIKNEYNLRNDSILWLSKQVFELDISDTVLKEDYLPLINAYNLNKDKLKPLNEYANISELNNDIENLGDDVSVLKEEDYGLIAEKKGWILFMPHTTRASQVLGKDTTWCTARAKSQNLFLNYVARFDSNIILFYIVKMDGNTRSNPNDKISVGFVNGEIDYGGFGGVTVNSNNEGLREVDISKILGVKTWKFFLDKMEKKSESIGKQHPAKKEMEKIAKSIVLLKEKIKSFKNENDLNSFEEEIVKYDLSYDVLQYFVGSDNQLVRDSIAQKNISSDILIQFADNKENQQIVRKSLARNPNIDLKIQEKLLNDDNINVHEALATNKNLYPSVKIGLIKLKDLEVNREIAYRKDNSEEIQIMLTKGMDNRVASILAVNDTSTEKTLNIITDYAIKIFRYFLLDKLAKTTFNSIHVKIFNINDPELDYSLFTNPSISKEMKEIIRSRIFEQE